MPNNDSTGPASDLIITYSENVVAGENNDKYNRSFLSKVVRDSPIPFTFSPSSSFFSASRVRDLGNVNRHS